MPTVSMNFEAVPVKYEPQTISVGLRSDGELVQAVSDAKEDAFVFRSAEVESEAEAEVGHDGWIPIYTISPPVSRDTQDATETHHFHITLEQASIASAREEQLQEDTTDAFLF